MAILFGPTVSASDFARQGNAANTLNKIPLGMFCRTVLVINESILAGHVYSQVCCQLPSPTCCKSSHIENSGSLYLLRGVLSKSSSAQWITRPKSIVSTYIKPWKGIVGFWLVQKSRMHTQQFGRRVQSRAVSCQHTSEVKTKSRRLSFGIQLASSSFHANIDAESQFWISGTSGTK